uniref:Uncharacterized protein n=1 Tax=Marseillevirus LCMAC202 TaxID=2506606 RepID=A0A481YZ38_9VIRU|nr:MAG: hypothetical protein LCMAC202_01500 [Marseillevirus LCMAC202]
MRPAFLERKLTKEETVALATVSSFDLLLLKVARRRRGLLPEAGLGTLAERSEASKVRNQFLKFDNIENLSIS